MNDHTPHPPVSDTIVAIATATGRGAVGIVRLSGATAFAIATQIAGAMPAPRTTGLRLFCDGAGQVLDQGLVLSFPGPRSFTGEDVVELQGHGGPVVLGELVKATLALGARQARPGEFSERAFLNGRIDLAQAEAIADLIDASSAQAARAASRSLDGELSRRVNALVEELIQLRVFVEGALDFSDEDVDWLAHAPLHERLAALLQNLRALIAQAGQGRRLREGLVITLAGQPNVGKSTLLNRLAGVDAAIVTDIAGTTRDVLRENILLDGMPITVVDTAGLRESGDAIEQEGVRRAWKAIEQAELALFVVDDRVGITEVDKQLLARLPGTMPRLVIRNKCDLSGLAPEKFVEAGVVNLRLSVGSDIGMPQLHAELAGHAGMADAGEGLFSARGRHVDALQRALLHSLAADQRLRDCAMPELAAEELREAQQALSEITGAFSADDLLGRVFSQFCIGK